MNEKKGIDRLTGWLTDIIAVYNITDELLTTHVVLFAIDNNSTHTSNQATVDAGSLADQRVVTVATHVEVFAEVDPAEFPLQTITCHFGD